MPQTDCYGGCTILAEGRKTNSEATRTDGCADFLDNLQKETRPILPIRRFVYWFRLPNCSIRWPFAPCSSTPSNPASMAFRAAWRKATTMTGISATSNARGIFSLDRLEISCESRNVPNKCRGGNGHRTVGSQRRMGVSSVVSDLHDDPSAACVNGIRDDEPADNLFCGIDSRVAGLAMGTGTECRPFRNDEARGSTLGVIPGVHRGRHGIGSRTHPCKWRHNDSIWKLDGPELKPIEERIVGLGQCEPLTVLSWEGRLK
jgi:hypothetical protein